MSLKDGQRSYRPARYKFYWSNYEKQFIIKNYKELSDAKIAERLKRSRIGVVNMRLKLKLKRELQVYRGYIVKAGFKERNAMLELELKVTMMRMLIFLIQSATSPYLKERYKKQLKNLSELKNGKLRNQHSITINT